MKIRIAGIADDSIVDGPGLRFTVFVQGCSHHCPGCHNPLTHDPNGGTEMDTDQIIREFSKNRLLSGITLSGGEPMEQAEACLELAKAAHGIGLSVWCYTGYTLDELLDFASFMKLRESGKYVDMIGNVYQFTSRVLLIHECDVLVDGPFIQEQRSLDLLYRGSRNQRLIDIRESIRLGYVELWKPQ